jgi:prepilin-type N-terminal cleavage/methylation domain-containing protein
MPDAANTSRQDDGFSLVELLVSLMVLVMVMSFVPGALRSGQRIWEMDRKLDQQAALSTFRRYVEQRLAEAMPLQARLPGRDVFLEFAGDPARLAFVAPAAAGPGGGGVYRFELELQGETLTLRQSLYRAPQADAILAANEAQLPGMERRLHGGVRSLALRYHGAPAQGQTAQWQDHWTRSDGLPDLVEISLATRDGVARTIVPLRLVGSP